MFNFYDICLTPPIGLRFFCDKHPLRAVLIEVRLGAYFMVNKLLG
jgi:hypothetical protein